MDTAQIESDLKIQLAIAQAQLAALPELIGFEWDKNDQGRGRESFDALCRECRKPRMWGHTDGCKRGAFFRQMGNPSGVLVSRLRAIAAINPFTPQTPCPFCMPRTSGEKGSELHANTCAWLHIARFIEQLDLVVD